MRVSFQSVHQQYQRAGRVVGTLRSQPSWLMKLGLLSVLVALAALGLLVLIPALVLALAVFVIGGGVVLCRWAMRSVTAWVLSPFGTRDSAGRRNVRVVSRP